MNKKGMLPRNWIVLVVVIGMLLAASSYWITAWQDIYASIESANLTSYTSMSEIAGVVDNMESKLQSETKATGVGFLDFIVQGGYNVLLSIISVPITIKNFVSDVGGQFGIPPIFINGVIILISVAAIFGIIGSIFRRKT
jgi:hypothetical protein